MTNCGDQMIITLSDDEVIEIECQIIETSAMILPASIKRTPLADLTPKPPRKSLRRSAHESLPAKTPTISQLKRQSTEPLDQKMMTPKVENEPPSRKRGRPKGKAGLKAGPEDYKPDKTDKIYGETFLSMIVVKNGEVPSKEAREKMSRRVEQVDQFVPKIPTSCSEASRAAEFGSFVIKYKWPGVPDRKFHPIDLKKFNDKDDWNVQAIYYTGNNRLMVYYEGWTCQTMSEQPAENYEDTAGDMVKMATIRRNFLDARRSLAMREALEVVSAEHLAGKEASLEKEMEGRFVNQDPFENMKKPHKLFWLFEDLTHFHTTANKMLDMGPVMYMACTRHNPRPPYYAYTPVNIVELNAFELCLRHKNQKPIDELLENRMTFVSEKTVNVCQSNGRCLCDIRFHLLFNRRTTQNLQYLSDSRLDFTGFDATKQRVVMECTEVCGCDWRCPRRQLQRGQQIPLVVNYESCKKGFGLRAAEHIVAGSLVCEYTGSLRTLSTDENKDRRFLKEHIEEETAKGETVEGAEEEPVKEGAVKKETLAKDVEEPEAAKDTSYEVLCGAIDNRMVICAKDRGNVARFINHSCSPNAAFVEVHSRRFEGDPLIPRVAVFATKDIPIGEEVTVAYWTSPPEAGGSGIRCRCNSANCMNTLPGS